MERYDCDLMEQYCNMRMFYPRQCAVKEKFRKRQGFTTSYKQLLERIIITISNLKGCMLL